MIKITEHYVCDRCGKVVKSLYKLNLAWDTGEWLDILKLLNRDKKMQICRDCMESLDKWYKSGGKK